MPCTRPADGVTRSSGPSAVPIEVRGSTLACSFDVTAPTSLPLRRRRPPPESTRVSRSTWCWVVPVLSVVRQPTQCDRPPTVQFQLYTGLKTFTTSEGPSSDSSPSFGLKAPGNPTHPSLWLWIRRTGSRPSASGAPSLPVALRPTSFRGSGRHDHGHQRR